MNYPSLEARHISRAFGPLKAIDDVSLSINAGEVIVLLGQSGSGKSTLLRVLAGLEGVDSGEVYAVGELVSRPGHVTPPERRGIGMVFQDYALFPHLNAVGNVAFGLQNLGKAKAQAVAREWLAKVGLETRATYFPHQLSGGEQQRVALARALAPQPSAVLMDEPFSGLDPHLRSDLQHSMLAALREAGVAALIVSHDTEEALAIADQVAIMDQGRIIQQGTPRAVYAAPCSLQAARALGPVWTFAAQGRNGQVETPMGPFSCSRQGPVVVGARPESTAFSPNIDGAFTVIDNRGVGRFLTTTLRGPTGLIQARIQAKDALDIGTNVAVTVASADIFVFGT